MSAFHQFWRLVFIVNVVMSILLGSIITLNGYSKRSRIQTIQPVAAVAEAEIVSGLHKALLPFIGDPYRVDIEWTDLEGKLRNKKGFGLDSKNADSVGYQGELFSTIISVAYVQDNPKIGPVPSNFVKHQKEMAGFRLYIGLLIVLAGLIQALALAWNKFSKRAH